MARLIVLGESGQLATELRRLAPAAGWDVATLGRTAADFTDPDAACAALAGAGPADAIINAAAYTAVDKAESEPEIAHRLNSETPGLLAELCARRGTPFLHVSTDYVFNGERDRPYREDDPIAPINVYGETKLAGERAVAAPGGPFLIARTSWVYSPHGANFVKTMLRLGRDRDVVRVVGDQRGCPTSATDLANGLLTAAAALTQDHGLSGVYHLAGTGETDWARFAEDIFALAEPHWGRRPSVTRIATEDYPTPARRPRNSRLDSTRFAETFGFRAAAWPQALKRVMDRLRDGGQI